MNNDIEIFDEEESKIHLTRLDGKVVRDGECPLKREILCEDCEFYDGWGIDIENHKADVYCNNPNIIEAKKLSLFGAEVLRKKKRKRKRKK